MENLDKKNGKSNQQDQRLPYESPQMNFIELRTEERLLACAKDTACCEIPSKYYKIDNS